MAADGGSEMRISGSIDLSAESAGVELTGQIHQVPCCIKYDGPSPVSHYFKPKPTGIEVDGLKVEEAYFRGRKLQGTTLPLPQGYSGDSWEVGMYLSTEVATCLCDEKEYVQASAEENIFPRKRKDRAENREYIHLEREKTRQNRKLYASRICRYMDFRHQVLIQCTSSVSFILATFPCWVISRFWPFRKVNDWYAEDPIVPRTNSTSSVQHTS